MPTTPTQADPVAALRAVLAENARIPALEAEIAHLRKHNASAELDAVLDALNEHPASPDMGDLPMADQVRLIVKWWDETEVENYAADDALDELGAPDEGTPAERIRALAAAKDRRIVELEAKVRALASDANSYGAKERECDELRSKLIERQEAMLRPLVDALLLITLTSSRLPEGWFQLTPLERAVWVCEHFDGATPGHTNEVSPCPDRS